MIVLGALCCLVVALACFAFVIGTGCTFLAIIPAFIASVPTGFYVTGMFLISLTGAIAFFFFSKYTLNKGIFGLKKLISNIALRRYATCKEKN